MKKFLLLTFGFIFIINCNSLDDFQYLDQVQGVDDVYMKMDSGNLNANLNEIESTSEIPEQQSELIQINSEEISNKDNSENSQTNSIVAGILNKDNFSNLTETEGLHIEIEP